MDMDDVERMQSRRRKEQEKEYRQTAILLDQFTDSLAIHQAVGDLNFSALVLIDDERHNGQSNLMGSSDAQLDLYQQFWIEVVEAK